MQCSCLYCSRSNLYLSLNILASSDSVIWTNSFQSSGSIYGCFWNGVSLFLIKCVLSLLLWVLHALAVNFMTCLNPNGFISGGTSKKGCTHLSNKNHFYLSLRDLKPGITRDSLCLAMRPASVRNLNFWFLSVGIPPRSIPVTTIMSLGHFVDVLALFRWPPDPSPTKSSSLLLQTSYSSSVSAPSSPEFVLSSDEAC